jgi:hypothetical protein
MVNYMLKEISDESLQLRKLLQKYKVDIKQRQFITRAKP